MDKLKVIILNLILVLGMAASLGLTWNNQQTASAASTGQAIQNNSSDSLAADLSGDQLSNTGINSQANCAINAAGGCAGCGACNGR